MGLIEGKIAAVTASTRGIGLTCAKKLAVEGATVYLAARNAERAQGMIDKIEAAGGHAKFVRFDAADKSTYAGFVNQIVAAEGRIDILVNSYGSTDVKRGHDIVNTKFEDIQEIMMDDVRSVWDSTQAAVNAMKGKGAFPIVNIASTGGIYPDLSRESYGLAKTAIIRLTKDTAIQYAHQGACANTVPLLHKRHGRLRDGRRHGGLGRLGSGHAALPALPVHEHARIAAWSSRAAQRGHRID